MIILPRAANLSAPNAETDLKSGSAEPSMVNEVFGFHLDTRCIASRRRTGHKLLASLCLRGR